MDHGDDDLTRITFKQLVQLLNTVSGNKVGNVSRGKMYCLKSAASIIPLRMLAAPH
jgi:hypothetical protein